MPKANVYNMAGKQVGEIDLSDAIFGIEPNESVVHDVVKNHLSNCRQGTQSALTRAEVSGGGKKPYRQKGTGSARQGSTRTPHYYHGGVAFAPKPRSYRTSLNKKVRRLAILSALSQKALDDAVIVVDGLEMNEIKTKTFKAFLDAVNVSGKALVVTPEVNDNIVKSARNIPGIQTTIASILSAYDVVNANTFIVDKAALAKIEEVYA
jgi:large subunit ribosomal protein L4